ncbi:hypothetical protein K445DRAFT_320838 [Daldinia sp. EC12]|nr:hypothetical protein K445DRAFT_320838 [Daldinia sp. EC12]
METQRRVVQPVSSRNWQIAKIALQTASLAFCIIVIGLSAGTMWGGDYGVGILTVPVTAATAAWTIAELVTLLVRTRRGGAPGRGIHPGAHVGVQLIIFLAMIYVLFYACMLWRSVQNSIVRCNEWERDPKNPDWVIENYSDVDRHSGFFYTRSFYCPESHRDLVNSKLFQSAAQALIAFCAMLWAIHFTLFVRACVETQRRNRNRPAAVVYPQPVWPAQYGPNYPPTNYPPRAGPGQTPMKSSYYN